LPLYRTLMVNAAVPAAAVFATGVGFFSCTDPVLGLRVRRLIPSLEQVTWREPTVTPICAEISSRLAPRARRSLICCMHSGVNLLGRLRNLGVVPSCSSA
jgi:hypothetical protein